MAHNPIGILGGIFDPVHNGHLSIASLARDFFQLSQVIFIPAGIPPHKSSTVVAAPAERVSMLKLAIDSEPAFSVWEGEICRAGYSYTIETLKALRTTYQENPFYFIIGSDNLAEIETWKNYREIIAMVTLCVAFRPGFPIAPLPESLAAADVRPFPSPEWGVSSSMIRTYLKNGYNCTGLLPGPILEYLRRNRVYS